MALENKGRSSPKQLGKAFEHVLRLSRRYGMWYQARQSIHDTLMRSIRSPNHTSIVSDSCYGAVRIWDAMLGESLQRRAPGPGWSALSPDGAASLQALVTIDKPWEDRLTRSVLLQQRRYSGVQSEVIISVPQQEPTASISLNISANVIGDRLHFRMIRTCTMMAGLLRGMDCFFSGLPWILSP